MPKPGLFGLPHAPSEHNWNLLHEAKWPTPPGREYLGSAYYEADSSSDDGGSAAAADTAQSLDDDDESSPWDYTGSAHTTCTDPYQLYSKCLDMTSEAYFARRTDLDNDEVDEGIAVFEDLDFALSNPISLDSLTSLQDVMAKYTTRRAAGKIRKKDWAPVSTLAARLRHAAEVHLRLWRRDYRRGRQASSRGALPLHTEDRRLMTQRQRLEMSSCVSPGRSTGPPSESSSFNSINADYPSANAFIARGSQCCRTTTSTGDAASASWSTARRAAAAVAAMAARCAANRARRRRRRRAPALTPPLQTLFSLSPAATAALRQGGGLLSSSHAAANQRILERATAFRACVRGPCGGSASQMSRAAKSSGCARIRALAAARLFARLPTSSLGADASGDDMRSTVQRRRCIRSSPAGRGNGAA
jgi:hypothetical protein